MKALKPLVGLHISGRRWFDRINGNTYNSVRIFANGEQLACLPYQYGYGDHYLTLAQDWLEEHGGMMPTLEDARLMAAAPDMLTALKQVAPMARTLMDELGKGPAAKWGVVNDCLIATAKVIAEIEGEL